MKTREIALSIIVILLSAWGYHEASSFTLGADMFPKLILGSLIFLAVLQLVSAVRSQPKSSATPAGRVNVTRVIGVAALCVVYVASISFIGYFIATAAFSVAAMLLMGQKRLRTIALSTVIVTLAMFLVFGLLLYVPVPRGQLFLR